jgi:hypothetical protein
VCVCVCVCRNIVIGSATAYDLHFCVSVPQTTISNSDGFIERCALCLSAHFISHGVVEYIQTSVLTLFSVLLYWFILRCYMHMVNNKFVFIMAILCRTTGRKFQFRSVKFESMIYSQNCR